jgi:hypothetical protein
VYDIVFISYNESNADENFARLKERFPLAKRVDGVKGIHQAHIAAARKSFTKMFWVVDGDAKILDSFNFDYEVSEWDLDVVHVWRSRNPVNGLEYGYGGVKLLPRYLTAGMSTNSVDMTMGISTKFKALPEISNITEFNTDAFGAWRSAFRECVKLTNHIQSNVYAVEARERLTAWKEVYIDVPFAEYARIGAEQGQVYATKNASDSEALRKINDFDWLREHYFFIRSQIDQSLEMPAQ